MEAVEKTLFVFAKQCAELSEQYDIGEKVVYGRYDRALSAGIDLKISELPAEYQMQAAELARQQFNYVTVAEVKHQIREDRELGLCCHGTERDHCAFYCGDRDED